jgi:hypothetical protein
MTLWANLTQVARSGADTIDYIIDRLFDLSEYRKFCGDNRRSEG